jgi:SulP family sulfate permease
VDNDQAGKTWDQDQDLIGQGLGKIAAGFSGAFPTSSSFSRSALNLFAGAQTGWASLVSVVMIWLCLLYLTPLLQPVPQSVLAAIVVAAVLGLIKPKQLLHIRRVDRVEAITTLVTLLITLLLAPQLYWGVLAGLLVALSHFLYVRMHPRIIEVGLHNDGSLRDRHLWHLPTLGDNIYALRMDAALDFAAAAAFEKNIVHAISSHPGLAHVCLFALPINRIDVTGTETMARLEKRLREQGITLHISGMKLPVETVLQRAGCLVPNPYLKMYRTDAEAIEAITDCAQL